MGEGIRESLMDDGSSRLVRDAKKRPGSVGRKTALVWASPWIAGHPAAFVRLYRKAQLPSSWTSAPDMVHDG